MTMVVSNQNSNSKIFSFFSFCTIAMAVFYPSSSFHFFFIFFPNTL
jgi:hypothetical protein